MQIRIAMIVIVLLDFACLSLVAAIRANPRGAGWTAAREDVLARSRAKYASLGSYADTGVVTTEYQSPGAQSLIERHTFTTYYRAPRRFFFEFNRDPKAGAERFVIWCDGADFHTWWSTTRVHEEYERGRGTLAFALASLPTKGSALQIPPLIFQKAGLQGPVAGVKEPRLAGTEEVGGRLCHKLSADVALAYATGRSGEARPTTIWIDAETLLIRKVFEGTRAGTGAGIVDRITTTFEARANPELDDARFRFLVPSEK